MAETALTTPGESAARIAGWRGIAADWSSDQRAFKNVSWGKAMMWIFLLSDTFIFTCFLTSYMNVRISTTVPWPNPSEVFALNIGNARIPLILIAIMTMVLITSSGTMAMAVNYGYRRDRAKTTALMMATAVLGAAFVSMQAFGRWGRFPGGRQGITCGGAPQALERRGGFSVGRQGIF